MYRLEAESIKRKRQGLTMGKLAKCFDVTKAEYQKWCQDGNIPDDKVKLLEDFFGLSKKELLTRLQVEVDVGYMMFLINEASNTITDYENGKGEVKDLIQEIKDMRETMLEHVNDFFKKNGLSK